ncbi:MAG: LptF/LptG family permease [Pelagibacteraceae bacterium]|nr:LptF/LptG family permease [Pelagibacteraceae bacterium]
MLSNKIYKHFFLELSKYFFLVLFTFSAIVWTVQAVNFLDLIVEDGHAVSLYLNYSLLNIPKILTKFIPLSFLLALVLTILKFDSENELIILWTSGLNKIKIINFFLKIALIVTLIQLFLAAFINPNVLNYSRSLIKASDLNLISSTIKTNEFNDTIEGLTIYVEEKNELGIMKNIFIRDDSHKLSTIENREKTTSLTIFAKKGRLNDKTKNSLILENGIIHSENKSGKIQIIEFKETKLAIDDLKTKSIIYPKVQETPSKILLNCFFKKTSHTLLEGDRDLKCQTKEERVEVLAEINRRFGMPLYIPLLALLSSFLLISREETKAKGWYKYFYFGLAFTILITAEILVRYSGKSLTHGLFYYLLPLFCIPVLYIELIRRFYYENLRK